jgi:hypothetical protein
MMKPWALVLLCLTLTACTNSKENRCATLRKVIRAEMAATKDIADKWRDPQALAAHSKILGSTITELRNLEIKDAALKQAVVTYLNALEKLAEGYQQAAEGLKLMNKGDYQAASDKMPGAGSGLIVYGTIVDSTRIRIADECNKP